MSEELEKQLRNAEKEIERLKKQLEKAEKDIALEKKRAMNEMKDDVYQIAMEIAEKLMAREITPEDQSALVDEFIQKIGEDA